MEKEGVRHGRREAEYGSDGWRKADEEEGEVRIDLTVVAIDREIEPRQAIDGEEVVDREREKLTAR